MTIRQPSSILSPYNGKRLPQKSDLAALLQDLRTALSDSGLDDYELAYAQTWLTRLFTICDDDIILDEAGELLSLTVPALQTETNRHKEPYCFESPQGQVKINVEESFMQDVHATGFRTWSSSIYLAQRMLADPSQFFWTSKPTMATRVLELGSGTGLAGIAAYHALLQVPGDAHLRLTDMDQATLDTLAMNVRNNIIHNEHIRVEVTQLDWTRVHECELKPFDTILGADLVYEPEHADLLHKVVEKLLEQTPTSSFRLIVVIRPTHLKDIAALEKRFSASRAEASPRLYIHKQEDIEASDDDLYPYPHRYYEIKWHGLRTP